LETFQRIAGELNGYTDCCIISIVDIYPKAAKRLCTLEKQGIPITSPPKEAFKSLMQNLSAAAAANTIEIHSCAEKQDLAPHGIYPGKCIDDDLIRKRFGIKVVSGKDPGQRGTCGCVTSRDIGMYETCRFGCVYCYATTRFDRAAQRHRQHDPTSPSLSGHYL
jgi:hypothetical protein